MVDPVSAAIGVGTLVTSVAGTGKRMKGQKAQAKAEAEALRREATQLRERAVYERAISHLEAGRYAKDAKRLLATQRTEMAASGLATDDAGAGAIRDETVRELSVNELLILHQADVEARGMETQAVENERAANAGLKAARIERQGMALSAASDWFSLYGGVGGKKGSYQPMPGGDAGTRAAARARAAKAPDKVSGKPIGYYGPGR